MQLSQVSLAAWIAFHVFSWSVQVAWGSLGGGGMDCEVFLCNSPLEGVGRILRNDPQFSFTFAAGILADVGSILWGLLTVQWDIWKGDSLVASTPQFFMSTLGAAAAAGFVVFSVLRR